MTLGFKRRFGLYVWLGSKMHTIRAPRKGGRPVRVGDTLNCFIDTRQKGMARLGDWSCIKIEPMRIESIQPEIATGYLHELQISIAGVTLDVTERESFCYRDGFRPLLTEIVNGRRRTSYQMFHSYWMAQAKGERKLPFDAELLYWRWDLEHQSELPKVYQYKCPKCWKLVGENDILHAGGRPGSCLCGAKLLDEVEITRNVVLRESKPSW